MSADTYPCRVIAKIPASIQPLERGSRYEDPLAATLAARGAGRVSGSGTQLNARMQIECIDVELDLRDLGDALQLARRTLVELGAPAGSLLCFRRDGRARALPVAADGVETDSLEASRAFVRSIDHAAHKAEAAAARAAVKVLASYRRLMTPQPETQPVDASRYDAPLIAWYTASSAALATLGYPDARRFCIAGPAPGTQPGTLPLFARKFLSADGRVRATAFRLPAPTGAAASSGAAAKPRAAAKTGVVGLASELDDGRFVATSNQTDPWNTPPHLLAERLAPGCAPAAVVARHQVRLDRFLDDHPERRLVTFASLEDLQASELRAKTLTAAYRSSQRLPSAAELSRLGSAPPMAAMIHAEMLRLLAGQP